MRVRKRVMALALASMMALTLAGCGSSKEETVSNDTNAQTSSEKEEQSTAEEKDQEETEKEPVTLVWWYRGNGEQKDTKMVQDALNEQLKTYPGLEHVTVELKCYTASEYKQAVTLAQSSSEQIDILNTVNLDFAEEVEEV